MNRFFSDLFLLTLWLLVLPVSVVSATEGPRVDLTASDGQYQFPFFQVPTPVWNYNGQIPGPTIRVQEGTTLTVDFLNRLDEPTTVHWHGIRAENKMDGVPGVTQDPIAPGARFVYRLELNEAGTFWYHPHLNNSEQLERGLKGILVVEEKSPKPWSRDIVMLVDDWRLQRDGSIFPHFNTPHDLMHDGRWGNVVTVNGRHQPSFSVRPGERIRIRLINGANARIFTPTLDGPGATVIAVDGRPVTSTFPLDRFLLSPGNRIDLDITIPPESRNTTFLLEDSFPRNRHTLASLQVENSDPVETPSFTPPLLKDFLPVHLFDQAPVTKTWDLSAFRGGEYGIGWGMNKRLWPDADTADMQLGIPQKIIFKNSSSRLHPMHLHGVFFRVLERNGQPAAEPFTRDTVLVGPREEVVIGLIPEHSGIWATHCHILEHAEAGMMSTFTARENE